MGDGRARRTERHARRRRCGCVQGRSYQKGTPDPGRRRPRGGDGDREAATADLPRALSRPGRSATVDLTPWRHPGCPTSAASSGRRRPSTRPWCGGPSTRPLVRRVDPRGCSVEQRSDGARLSTEVRRPRIGPSPAIQPQPSGRRTTEGARRARRPSVGVPAAAAGDADRSGAGPRRWSGGWPATAGSQRPGGQASATARWTQGAASDPAPDATTPGHPGRASRCIRIDALGASIPPGRARRTISRRCGRRCRRRWGRCPSSRACRSSS